MRNIRIALVAVCFYSAVLAMQTKQPMLEPETWGHVAHYKLPGKIVAFKQNRMNQEIEGHKAHMQKYTLEQQKHWGLDRVLEELQQSAHDDVQGLFIDKQGYAYGYVDTTLHASPTTFWYSLYPVLVAEQKLDDRYKKGIELSDENLRMRGITMQLATDQAKFKLRRKFDKDKVVLGVTKEQEKGIVSALDRKN